MMTNQSGTLVRFSGYLVGFQIIGKLPKITKIEYTLRGRWRPACVSELARPSLQIREHQRNEYRCSAMTYGSIPVFSRSTNTPTASQRMNRQVAPEPASRHMRLDPVPFVRFSAGSGFQDVRSGGRGPCFISVLIRISSAFCYFEPLFSDSCLK